MGVTNHLLSGMILQVGGSTFQTIPTFHQAMLSFAVSEKNWEKKRPKCENDP